MSELAAYEKAEALINQVYDTTGGDPRIEEYMERHAINSLGVLTIDEYMDAMQEIEKLWPHIKGKTVVEIGAGVGMLALQMAKFAKRVFAIEADPSWSWVFTECLYELKPPNLTFILGSAQEMVGILKADVAVIYTRSDVAGMHMLAKEFAPVVIHGPLVPYDLRQKLSAEDAAFVERVAAKMGRENFGVRGFDQAELQAAIDEETRLSGRTERLAFSTPADPQQGGRG